MIEIIAISFGIICGVIAVKIAVALLAEQKKQDGEADKEKKK